MVEEADPNEADKRHGRGLLLMVYAPSFALIFGINAAKRWCAAVCLVLLSLQNHNAVAFQPSFTP